MAAATAIAEVVAAATFAAAAVTAAVSVATATAAAMASATLNGHAVATKASIAAPFLVLAVAFYRFLTSSRAERTVATPSHDLRLC